VERLTAARELKLVLDGTLLHGLLTRSRKQLIKTSHHHHHHHHHVFIKTCDKQHMLQY